jgi:hypothetical protein
MVNKSLPENKLTGHEADHSLSSVEDKHEWSYTTTPHYVSTGVVLK